MQLIDRRVWACSEGTEQVLQWLERNNVSATFFVLGQSLSSSYGRSVLKRMHRKGHNVENHSYDHSSFTDIDEGTMRWQLEETSRLIRDAIGRKPRYFRPPYGSINDWMVGVVQSVGLTAVNWNIDTNDWAGQVWGMPSQIAGHGGQGPIILQHDRSFDEDCQDEALKQARRRGFRPVTLDVCLGHKNEAEIAVPDDATTSQGLSSSSSSSTTTTAATPTAHHGGRHRHHPRPAEQTPFRLVDGKPVWSKVDPDHPSDVASSSSDLAPLNAHEPADSPGDSHASTDRKKPSHVYVEGRVAPINHDTCPLHEMEQKE